MAELRQRLSELLLLVPAEKVECFENQSLQFEFLTQLVSKVLVGESANLLSLSDFTSVLTGEKAQAVLSQYPSRDLHSVLVEFIELLVVEFDLKFGELGALFLQLVAVALLQLYIQCNFTGPESAVASRALFFPEADEKLVHQEAVKLLNIEGKTAYDLMTEPVFLVLSLLVFERLQGVAHSLVKRNPDISIEELTGDSLDTSNPVNSSLLWWRARALQVHLCVISEPSDILASVSSMLLRPEIVSSLAPESSEIQKHLNLIFLLEAARNGIHAQTEHLSEPFLKRASGVSQLQFVLSGAKAKRTKFQSFHTATLILLAKSTESNLYSSAEAETPESFELDSDLLLERPHYESLDDLENTDNSEPDSKKIKLDAVPYVEEDRIFPIASTQDDIPSELRELDPNNQPTLNDLDNVQLLLRMTTLKQTSPVGNTLVEEELAAVVNRIVYSKSKSINWTVYGRALWERSVLETNRSRTVERGILQMTSLVEEVGIKIKSRVIPQASNSSPVSSRLRYIHQLPLMAQWNMDAKLAEKYMSLGVLKSAIEIYERLNMVTEAALCYAAVDNEAEAERLLVGRIQTHPEDARAISIYGDLRQEPELWMKAWEIGRYAKAKASLCKYYYNPPQSSGLTRNLPLAIEHMHDCLSASPLSYENWFFYGCCGLEAHQYELASEAFTRCVSLDDSNSHAWSNLASALLRLDKTRQAFNALKRALQQGDGAKRSWRIYENYMLVAAKLGEWNDVLHATRELISIRLEGGGLVTVDVEVVEKLMHILVEEPYLEETRLTHFQKSCTDLICNVLPSVIDNSARCWRVVSRVELWRGKPWAALECHEKAYRATSLRPELDSDEQAWNDAVEACSDLVSAYESLGELPGKHGAGDVVCKDWKFKARTCVRSLMSKGKAMWEDSEGWNVLQGLKEDIASA